MRLAPKVPPLALALALAGCASGGSAGPPDPTAAELALVERRLEGFYGPMLYLVEESRLAIEDVLFRLDREYVFHTDRPLPQGELRFWLFRAENDLMPRNEEMVTLALSARELVEGEKLPKILDALVEHQTSWRELHARWKKDGVGYEWRSKTPFPRDLGPVLAREFSRLKARHAELLRQVPGAERKHIERQIARLYGPLVRLNREAQLAKARIAEEMGRAEIFPLDPAKKDRELETWLAWCEKILFPAYEEMRLTMKKNIHLVEGREMPPAFLDFLDYWNSWKVDHARWKREGVSYSMRPKRGFPQKEFAEQVEKTWQDLVSRGIRLRS